MPTKSKPTGGATKPRQFRFTDGDLGFIDDIAAAIAKTTGIPPTRTEVLRAGILLMADKWLKSPSPPASRRSAP